MTQIPIRPASDRPAPPLEDPVEPQARRARWPWIAGGLLVMAGLGPAAYAVAREEPATPPAPTVSDGTFALTVTGAECGVPAVGPADLRQVATGQFCLINVNVRNTGTEPALLDSGAQQATDSAGRGHSVADGAAVFLNDGTPSLLDQIPAGETVSGVLPYDVPKGVTLTALTVRESMTGQGVKVSLS